MANEKRLIDANALIRRFKVRGCFKKEMLGCMVAKIINTAPTEDAVEVVRCKDCKNYQETIGKDSGKPCGYGSCTSPCWVTSIVYDEDFCSYGERGRR